METMDSFEAMLDASFRAVRGGDLVKGTIVQSGEDACVVDIGSYMDGILTRDQLLYDGETMEQYPEGTELTLIVRRVNSRNSQILLSKKEADQIVIWDELDQKRKDGEAIGVRVQAAVRGGLRIQYRNMAGFMPASQVENHYVEDLTVFEGRELEALILDVNREKHDFTASRRELIRRQEAMAKERAFQTLQPGDRLQGRVVRLASYGAFVELEAGVTGLLHVSDMAWTRVKDPADIVTIGDWVTVAIQEIDAEKGRIRLSLKDTGPDPWENLSLEAGDLLADCTVTHLIGSGAFIQLTPELEGFLPISQISEKRIHTVREAIREGDRVNVKIMSVDPETKRISVSMREAAQGSDLLADQIAAAYHPEPEELTSSVGDALANLNWEDE